MNEYAYYGKGHTIHSSGQIEWHTNTVDDKTTKDYHRWIFNAISVLTWIDVFEISRHPNR